LKPISKKLNKEQVLEWLNSPVSNRYFEILKEEATARRAIVASGGAKKQSAQTTGEEYVRILTQADVYDSVSQPLLEDILTEEELSE
jgi:hypothetical protein